MEVNDDRILLVLPVSHLSFPRVFGGISFKPHHRHGKRWLVESP